MSSFTAATAVIDRAIERAQGPLPPPFLVEFLLEPWRRFLASIYRDFGENSTEWASALQGTELLLWSIAPKPTENEKAALSKALKALVATVRNAMRIAGWDRAAQAAFLRELRKWHLHLIERQGGHGQRGAAPDESAKVDLADTVHLDPASPHYREYLEMLDVAIVEQIEI